MSIRAGGVVCGAVAAHNAGCAAFTQSGTTVGSEGVQAKKGVQLCK